ncbi:hypothetical protein RyT2_29470 [Pseudolactococcus yaeyamensis]
MVHSLGITRSILEKLCIYRTIAHAVSLLTDPYFDYEHSWDGNNYSLQDSQGGKSTISFFKGLVVGAFRNENLPQDFKSAVSLLEGADEKFIELAKSEAFEYLLDDLNGEVQPFVMTTFWGEEEIFSNDSLDDFNLKSNNLLDFIFWNEKNRRGIWKKVMNFL